VTVRTDVLVALVAALVVVGTAAPVAGATGDDREELRMELTEDGDATVSLVSVYDLSDDDERAAFDSLADDEEALSELLDRFEERLASVADATGQESAAVTGESIDVRTDDDRGVVTLSVSWAGLATVEDGALVLEEPFASGFEPDRPLVVVGPEGSTVESVAPDPSDRDGATLAWDGGTDLEGFSLTVALADGATDDSDEADDGATDGSDESEDGATDGEVADSVPGFGVTVALVAILALVGWVGRRRLSGSSPA